MSYGTGRLLRAYDGTYSTRYADGNKPHISSVSGAFENGSTITINGHFSAARNGESSAGFLFSIFSKASERGHFLFCGDDMDSLGNKSVIAKTSGDSPLYDGREEVFRWQYY